MNVHSSGQPSSPAAGAIDSGEWDARVKLAACYRMVARLGMDDLIYNHISARVPGHEDQFLINPYGLLFDEITASTLVKITQGDKLDDTPHSVNAAAGGAALVMPPHEVCDRAAWQFWELQGDILVPGEREWPALMRQLDRTDPSYRN